MNRVCAAKIPYFQYSKIPTPLWRIAVISILNFSSNTQKMVQFLAQLYLYQNSNESPDKKSQSLFDITILFNPIPVVTAKAPSQSCFPESFGAIKSERQN